MSKSTLSANQGHKGKDFETESRLEAKKEAEHYLKSTPTPRFLPTLRTQVEEFIKIHNHSRNIVVVTSGGTTVPLEANTVRFLDNFSAGTRGATSAEWFLNHGYAVIFLHRTGSLKPFVQQLNSDSALDCVELGTNGIVQVKAERETLIRNYLEVQQSVADEHTLLQAEFTSVDEYLHSLRLLASLLAPLGPRVVFYLAAAVSDYYLPASKLSEHKIQSGETKHLNIELDPVPKFLLPLVEDWVPRSMVISFKLETDDTILHSKIMGALRKYRHELVIGNLLNTRKEEVILANSDSYVLIRRDNAVTVEEAFLPRVRQLHESFLNRSEKQD